MKIEPLDTDVITLEIWTEIEHFVNHRDLPGVFSTAVYYLTKYGKLPLKDEKYPTIQFEVETAGKDFESSPDEDLKV